MIQPIDVIAQDSCCWCAPFTYRTTVLKCNMIGNDNVLTQDMMVTPNTKYIIKYDYVIDTDYPTRSETVQLNESGDSCCSGIYYSGVINIPTGSTIILPDGYFLVNQFRNRIDFTVAKHDMKVLIASETQTSCTYKIQKAIVVPEGCIIQFDGGSIANGVLIGDKTILLSFQKNNVVLKNIIQKGTFTNVFEMTVDEVDAQAGEKIVDKKRKITLRCGRETVSFNIYSFDIVDISRVIKLKYGDGENDFIEVPISKGTETYILPTAEELNSVYGLNINKTLEGWYYGDGTKITGNSISLPSEIEDDWQLEINARWTYTITYHRGNNVTLDNVATTSITLPVVNTNDEVPFFEEKWYIDQTSFNSESIFNIEQNTDFYAHTVDYALYIYANSDGTGNPIKIYTNDRNVNLNDIPAVINSSIVLNNIEGWYIVDGDKISSSNIIPFNGTGLYKIYPKYNTCTVTWKGLDNETIGTTTVEYGNNSITTTNQPTTGFDDTKYVIVNNTYYEYIKQFIWDGQGGSLSGNYTTDYVDELCWEYNNAELNFINNITSDITIQLSNKNSHKFYNVNNTITNSLISPDKNRTNWHFVEWNTESDGSGDSLDETITKLDTINTNIKFWAIWIQRANKLYLKSFENQLNEENLNEEYLNSHGESTELTENSSITIDGNYDEYHYIYTIYEIEVKTPELSGSGTTSWKPIEGSSYDSTHKVYIIHQQIDGQDIKFNYKNN